MKRFSILSLLFSAIAFQSGNVRADEPLTSHEGLQSTLWVQTSLEYQLAAHQCYNTATDRLPFYLANVNHSATVETSVNFRLLPPAVIMDVDETVLDNSPFQARMVQDETQYAEEDWDAWVKEMNADAVPGAVGFIHFARSKGVKVFFVTNRKAELKEPTVRNLRRELAYQVAEGDVLCKGEREAWGSDKTSRRIQISQSYRVLMLFGDDFNDFVRLGSDEHQESAKGFSPSERVRMGSSLGSRLGRDWFLLPNPNYGSWEKSAFEFDYDSDRASRLKLKYRLLEPRR